MPELGIGMTYLLLGATFIGGVVIGTQTAWWVQILLVIGLVLFYRGWLVRGSELGAINYFLISAFLVVGCIVGNVSYILQTGPEINLSVVKDLFIVNK